MNHDTHRPGILHYKCIAASNPSSPSIIYEVTIIIQEQFTQQHTNFSGWLFVAKVLKSTETKICMYHFVKIHQVEVISAVSFSRLVTTKEESMMTSNCSVGKK